MDDGVDLVNDRPSYVRKGDPFPHARAEMTNYEVFKSYSDLLGETLDKYDLKGKPSQIYNCDESGMPLEHKMPRTISAKGTKKVRQCSFGNKTQITVLVLLDKPFCLW